MGELLAEEFQDLLETVETVQELGDVIGFLLTEGMDFDIRLFGEATVTKPKSNDVLAHIRRAEVLLSDATHLRVLTPSIFPAALEKLLEEQAPDHHEAILIDGALEAVRADPAKPTVSRYSGTTDWNSIVLPISMEENYS
jgi:hypothetical protein